MLAFDTCTKTNLMNKYLFLFFLSSLGFSLQAQDWTLERCVQYALENNISVKQAELTARNADLSLDQNKYNRLPSVSASSSAGYNFGRTINPTTNSFENTRIGFNNLSVSANVNLFAGGRINHQIKQSGFDVQAAQQDAKNRQQQIALSVATNYLNALLGLEQLANAQTQLRQSQDQLERTQRLINAGQLPKNARLDLEAQVARNEQLVVDAQNAVDLSHLNLKQLLQLDATKDFQLDQPVIEIAEDMLVSEFNVEEVYQAALNTQASIAAAEARVASSQAGEKVAKSAYLPSLSAFGSLSSIYSSTALDFNNPNTDNAMLTAQTPVPVTIGGVDQQATFYQVEGITFPKQSYGDQLDQNFGQSVGLNLSIPIYSNHRNKIGVERARLNTLQSELNSTQAKDQLKVDIQNAVTSFRAARNSYLAAERSLAAAQAALDDAQRRFDLGAINSFEFNNAVNNLDIARIESTRAKYQLLFNLKVVEFYQGKNLNL